MSTYLYRLARFAVRRRRLVLAIWLTAAALAVAVAQATGGKADDNFTIPGTEAQRAADVLAAKLPALSGGQTTIVFAAGKGDEAVAGAAAKAAIERSIAGLSSVAQVADATDPFSARLISPDQNVALGQVQWTTKPTEVKDANLEALEAAMAPARAAGLQVEYAGTVYPGWRPHVSELPELIGLIVAFVILLITFGAMAAAGLPILSAIVGVVITLMGVTSVASVITVATASTTVALMLGLSCGIDYGLFILSRHRTNLLNGMTSEESVPLAVGTAGSSVVFAALTVIIALCGMSVVGIPFLTVMGLSSAAAVAVALLMALTLLPALLGFAGGRVAHFTRLPLLGARAERVARRAASHPGQTGGAAWARFVVRRRKAVLLAGTLTLAVLAIPAAGIQLGLPSDASQPTDRTQRQAYDLTTAGFGAGANAALLIVATDVDGPNVTGQLANALAKVPGVAQAVPLITQDGVALVRVVPRYGPNDPATADVVHAIRDDRQSIQGSTGAHLLVGGTTAANIDISAKLSAALPTFLIVVVGLAFILLTFAFRTILVPIKSILGFLLSMAAALGAQVAMFQWGWGRHLFGITPSETTSFLPIIMLAIIFGLSSDYEVFVVSRIKEEFAKSGDARTAVQRGTGMSTRVVTAAALIMFGIFVAFMFTDDPTIRAIGFSFATGVFLDAFVVRLTLVPAVMALVGSKLWYHPRWFEAHVPDPDIEGRRLAQRLEPAPVKTVTPAPEQVSVG